MPSRIPRSLVVLAAVALATGCADSNGPGGGGAITIIPNAVSQATAGFTPNPLVLTRGEGRTVTWKNNDFAGTPAGGTTHWLLSDENLFDSGGVAPDQEFTFTFPAAGTYHYRCKNHLAMTGTITVAD